MINEHINLVPIIKSSFGIWLHMKETDLDNYHSFIVLFSRLRLNFGSGLVICHLKVGSELRQWKDFHYFKITLR